MRERVCVGCGAALPASSEETVTCTYCGRVYEDADPLSKIKINLNTVKQVRSVRGVGCFVLAVSAPALIGVAISIMATAGSMNVSHFSGVKFVNGVNVTLPHPSTRSGYLWADIMGWPVPIEIGRETFFMGGVRQVEADDTLYVRAINEDGSQRWQTDALGTYSQGYTSTKFAEVGGVVAVTDYHAKVHLLDASSGQPLRDPLSLTDKADAMCVRGDFFRVEQVDRKTVRVNPRTGEVTEAADGAPCPGMYDDPAADGISKAPSVPGVQLEVWFPEVGVAVGHKAPGTPTPKLVGWDPATRKPRFQVDVAAVDPATVRKEKAVAAAHGDRVVVVYGEGQDAWHVAMFDAVSGARLWDVVLRGILAVDNADRLVIAGDRVLVERTSSLDILDASDGAYVATVGDETYDR